MSGLEAVEEAMGSPDRHHVVVVAERLDALPTDTPVRIATSTTLHDIPRAGYHPRSWWRRTDPWPTGESSTPRLFAGRSTAPPRRGIASVCTGSLLLAGAGLLQGRPAILTGHTVDSLTGWERGTSQGNWVEDGRYLTGAGVSAGIDTALRLASRLASDEMSRLVQLAIEYDPRPSPRWDRLVHG